MNLGRTKEKKQELLTFALGRPYIAPVFVIFLFQPFTLVLTFLRLDEIICMKPTSQRRDIVDSKRNNGYWYVIYLRSVKVFHLVVSCFTSRCN